MTEVDDTFQNIFMKQYATGMIQIENNLRSRQQYVHTISDFNYGRFRTNELLSCGDDDGKHIVYQGPILLTWCNFYSNTDK